MENPLKNIQLKDWPDFLLAVSGASLCVSVIAILSGSALGASYALLFGGVFLFGVGGKIAHYKYRDPDIKGNINAWFTGWRHGLLADSFAIIGILLVFLAIYAFLHF